MERPSPLDPVAAFAAIQAVLDETDTVGRPDHARDKMRERQVTFDDVHLVLRTGTVASDPEWNQKHGNWKYRVHGKDCEGDSLTLVIALEPAFARITLITCF